MKCIRYILDLRKMVLSDFSAGILHSFPVVKVRGPVGLIPPAPI